MLDVLINAIDGAPTTIQFAKDRKFEEAWIVAAGGLLPSSSDIASYLAREPYRELIVEYIWHELEDARRFVLTVVFDGTMRISAPQQQMEESFRLVREYKDFSSFICQFDECFIGAPYLFRQSVDSVTIGIFNYWLSVGPIEVWKHGDSVEEDRIRAYVKNRPDIERSTKNYQGLFFRFNVDHTSNGPYYGIKTPCCKKQGSEWVISYPLLFHWLHAMVG